MLVFMSKTAYFYIISDKIFLVTSPCRRFRAPQSRGARAAPAVDKRAIYSVYNLFLEYL